MSRFIQESRVLMVSNPIHLLIRFIINPTQLGYTPLVPYVIDDTVPPNVFSSQLLPPILSSLSSAFPNFTQFPSLSSIVAYEEAINEQNLHSSKDALPRPVAGYDINQISSASNGHLNLGYSILMGSNPAVVPLMIHAMEIGAQYLTLGGNTSQSPAANLTSKMVSFPAQPIENLESSWGVPLAASFIFVGMWDFTHNEMG